MRLSFFVAFVFSSCVHAPAPVVEPEPPGVCELQSAVAATRKPKPAGYPHCSTVESRDAYKLACLKDDFEACHHIATCLVADGAMKPEGSARKPYMELARTFLKNACQAGIAESCSLRAGAGVEAGMTAKETCDDLTRATQLGDVSAQLSCMGSCL
jgi:hypothetical protein